MKKSKNKQKRKNKNKLKTIKRPKEVSCLKSVTFLSKWAKNLPKTNHKKNCLNQNKNHQKANPNPKSQTNQNHHIHQGS
jgi:hypothetical protein